MKNYFHEDNLTDASKARVLVEYSYQPGTSTCINGPLLKHYDGVADQLNIVAAWLTDAHGQIAVFKLPEADCVRIEAVLRETPPETEFERGRPLYR